MGNTGWWLKAAIPQNELEQYAAEVTRMCRATPFKLLAGAEGMRIQEDNGAPVVRVFHTAREPVAAVARWTLDFWPSAQISVTWGNPDHDTATSYIETGI